MARRSDDALTPDRPLGGAQPDPTGRDGDADAEQVVTTTRYVWLLLGSIAFAKLGTILIIVWASRPGEVAALVTATTWHWLPIAGALLAGPVLFRLRLRRVRAKREALRRAEWMLPEGVVPASVTSADAAGGTRDADSRGMRRANRAKPAEAG